MKEAILPLGQLGLGLSDATIKTNEDELPWIVSISIHGWIYRFVFLYGQYKLESAHEDF